MSDSKRVIGYRFSVFGTTSDLPEKSSDVRLNPQFSKKRSAKQCSELRP